MYERYRRAIGERPLPLALVDLDAFDANVETLLAPVRARGKTLRVASKSIRCVALLRLLRERPAVRGLMCFTVREAEFLAARGFDDLLVAYPSAHPDDARRLAALAEAGKTVSIVADDEAHLAVLSAHAGGAAIPVLADADMAYRPLGGRLHLGVQRSPLRSAAAVIALAARIADTKGLRFHGVMAYEAQIAGVQDASPYSPWMNRPKRWMKQLSRPAVERTRREIAEGLARRGLGCEVFNGGGTGSLSWCTGEDALTEVTAGSGFLDSHLFDYYAHLSLRPAAMFALQVVRRPGPGFVACHGGGYVASGEAGPDKLPRPYLPEGLSLTALEGAGEVQTPLAVRGAAPALGAPVFFRHAKAGELAEHFERYLLLRGDEVVDEVPTYRGEGGCFL